MARVEFRFGGSGGQGVISAGILLASAAVNDGKQAIQSQSYGPEARGGTSKAEVIISDEGIDYPKATTPDYIICLNTASFGLYGKTACASSIVIVDDEAETDGANGPFVSVPIMRTAREINPQSANVVAVAFLSAYTGIVTREGLLSALKELFPRFYDKNVLCAEAGAALAAELK